MRLKKILAILLTAVLLVSSTVIALPVSADGDTILGGGTGEQNDPYLINSKDDLLELAALVNAGTLTTSGKFFKQTADIDLADVAWTGIGNDSKPFNGTYDGDDHVINNLALKDDQTVNGLFGYVKGGATIKNVGIASGNSTISVSSNPYIGNLVGMTTTDGGTLTISNCFNAASLDVTMTADVKGGHFVGGLLGNIQVAAEISNCWNTGDITVKFADSIDIGTVANANMNTGGIAARAKATKVENCHSICDISIAKVGDWGSNGSLIGKIDANCTLTNCSAGGSIKATASTGGLAFVNLFVGYNGATLTFIDCTYSATGKEAEADITTDVHDADHANVTKVDSILFVKNYAQNGEVEGNSVRFVSELAFSTAAFTKTGFEVKVTYNGNTTEPFPLEGAVVYEKLSAGEGTVSPENGKYFIAYGISDIPADANATFEVTPYVVTLGGDYIYGSTATVEMTNGDIPEA